MDSFANVKDASRKEKLKAVDQEVKKLLTACKKAGYSSEKIRQTAIPLLEEAKKGQRRVYLQRVVLCLCVVGTMAGIANWKTANRTVSAVSKKFMVDHVLPYYDWTWLWNEECIVGNPYYEPTEDNVSQGDCEVCRNMKNSTILNDVNLTFMADTIFRMEPTLIADATTEWPAMTQSLSLAWLSQLYRTNANLQGYDKICGLKVSRGLDLSQMLVQELFDKVEEELRLLRDGNFTAVWNACHKNSSREMHKLYYRPYFLPGMCEPSKQSNYVLAGRKSPLKSRALLFEPQTAERGFWVAQVLGVMEVVLKPNYVCQEICSPIHFTLEKGHIINVPNRKLFDFGFRPKSEEAIALAVSYDYS